jgi:CBS domain-containing protein
MARYIREIMNRELLSVGPYTDRHAVLDLILARGVTAVPVLDEEQRPIGVTSLRDIVDDSRPGKVSTPARTVAMNALVEDAGRTMLDAGTHHLVVVGSDGRAVGIVSSLDLVRALLGSPPAHPPTFPHRDRALDVAWSDPLPFDAEHVMCAPREAGVLLLSAGGVGRTETDIWVDSSEALRARLADLIARPQDDPALEDARKRRDLRFRCAVVDDARHRDEVLRRIRARLDGASGWCAESAILRG